MYGKISMWLHSLLISFPKVSWVNKDNQRVTVQYRAPVRTIAVEKSKMNTLVSEIIKWKNYYLFRWSLQV